MVVLQSYESPEDVIERSDLAKLTHPLAASKAPDRARLLAAAIIGKLADVATRVLDREATKSEGITPDDIQGTKQYFTLIGAHQTKSGKGFSAREEFGKLGIESELIHEMQTAFNQYVDATVAEFTKSQSRHVARGA